MEIHISLQRIFLLAAIQGWFPGSESQDFLAFLPESIPALRGSCVEIPCTFPRVPAGFHLIWYRDQAGTDPIIFNNKNPLDIHEAFRGRTFLVGNESNSCSLRIDDVRDSETYYPCINGNINCNALRGFNKVWVQVSDTPEKPVLTLPPSLTEGTPARITCSVRHTCTHNPPVLLWNKVGFNRTERNEKLEGGVWRFLREMDYIPTYQDHGSPIVCESIYRSGQVSQETATLDITFNAKVVQMGGQQDTREGEVLDLECVFLLPNSSSTQYSWYRNGIPLNQGTQRTLRIYDVKESDSGNYSCKVHTPNGNFSALSLTVTVIRNSVSISNPIPIPSIIIIIIIPLLSGSLLLLLILCCICRRKCQCSACNPRSNNLSSEVCEATYMNLGQRDLSAEYSELKGAETTDSPYTALQKPNTDTYDEIKPPIGRHNNNLGKVVSI
uniref:Ig-like domain-containing protein n=1 Tax=Xenopus tropicalis TaxID=8364 RepID=A0A1B8Y700_XENTR|eukprot:XP_017945134.1 PREDICTED: sialoadhesin-like [Xenopus tropicalis]